VKSPLRTCIYCAKTKVSDAFDREHVLSEAFGHFENAPTLDCVCLQCNRHFANELELHFARHSLEALLRYRSGLSATPSRQLRYVDLTIPGPGEWEGVRLVLKEENGQSVVTYPPQVAFPLKSGGWVHFTEEEIDRGALGLQESRAFDTVSGCVFTRSEDEQARFLSKLSQHGVAFKKLEPIAKPPGAPEEMEVEVSFRINRGIRRTVAKYSFNFLAYSCGADFVLGSDFNAARRFVRFGEVPGYRIVRESFQPILRDDEVERRQTSGHLLTVDWNPVGGVLGQVSLFNHTTYRVALTRNYSGVWRPIRSGLHFNHKTGAVDRLRGVPGMLIS
jgi:hypothetical protein